MSSTLQLFNVIVVLRAHAPYAHMRHGACAGGYVYVCALLCDTHSVPSSSKISVLCLVLWLSQTRCLVL